ncbi:MAG: site-specific tyrosine recombinase/integron integrase [Patescibacteria group bacterium]
MADIRQLLKDYLDYLEIEKNRSLRTRRNYEHYLNAFFQKGKITALKELTPEKIKDFRLALAREENLKKSTQAYYIIALRNFLRYLIKQDYEVISPDKIELPKIPQRQIEVADSSEVERLLNAPEGADLRSLRDRAILETFFSTGLRLSELCKLSRYLNFDQGEISVRGKGEKLRLVFLSSSARQTIKNYLAKRGDADEALFISLTKNKSKPEVIGRITPRAVQRLVNYYARKAGITKRLTPHGLRHLFATDLLMNGADLRSVQELLGHSSISTTQVYTHVTNRHLREVHSAFHGKRRS